VAHQLEIFLIEQMLDIPLRASEEVVDAYKVAARHEEAVA
jgi:hypothetical protein